MSRIKELLRKDVAELFIERFKDPLHAMLVWLVITILVSGYFWYQEINYENENDGETSRVRTRNTYIAISSSALTGSYVIGEFFRRRRKKMLKGGTEG